MVQSYKHLSQRQQILTRPGQHIGSIKNLDKTVWVYENERIQQKTIRYNSGLIHIFYEILSNAQDNYFRSKDTKFPCKKIKIDITEDGWVSVWNDGLWIPTKIHEYGDDETKLDGEHYEAEIIFGHLNSSGNYDDDKNNRIGAGLHGHGAKLTNIFSKQFKVETMDPENGKKFQQEFQENMSITKKPKITSNKSKKSGYTKISYLADFSKFSLENYSEDLKNAMKKLCYDCAMITGVQVYYNDEKITNRDLSTYTDLYYENKDEKIEFKTRDSHVIIRPSIDHYDTHHISFVNGVLTPKGGIHVNSWCDSVLKPLSDMIRKKFVNNSNLSSKFTKGNLTNYFVFFIQCNLKNPDFESQTKQQLVHPKPTVEVQPTKIKKMLQWQFIKDIEDLIASLNNKVLQKTDGAKTRTVHIEKACDANKAGTKESTKCTLFLTEGLSAKTFAIKGIDCIEKGKDYFGVMPLRGKLLNVRNASMNQLKENKELNNLKKMLGLRHNIDYTNPEHFDTLRYGKLMILTDQDYDGNHIKGLIINLFDKLYPSLMKTDFRIFLNGFKTPIVRVSLGRQTYKNFYDMPSFKKWYNENKTNVKQDKIKYFKGLGTWKDIDVVQLFKDPVYIKYLQDATSKDMIDTMFNDKKVQVRKELLKQFTSKEYSYAMTNEDDKCYENVPITNFIQYEFLEYSMYDNKRSIPNIIDGLKPSQRKALWVALHSLSTCHEEKVEQFANTVSKKSNFHHGEDSMKKTIIKMAQTYLASNNIAYFKEEGQFGTRLEGGNDHASPRYIFVKLEEIIRKIFRKEDDCILNYIEDEGQSIEPDFFYPIVPMAFINGVEGIGTGYRSKMPSYNPIFIVNAIKKWLDNEPVESFTPWYRGFKGKTHVDKNTITYKGIVESIGHNKWHIKELPIKVWTEPYQEKVLNPLIDKKIIQNFTEYNTAFDVSMIIQCSKFKDEEDAMKQLKLTSSETIGTLPFFNAENRIEEYNTLHSAFDYYCTKRLHAYTIRKKLYLNHLKKELEYKQCMLKFIEMVIKNKDILKKDETYLIDTVFVKHKFVQKDNTYNYLLNIPIRQFTTHKKQQLEKQIHELKQEYDTIQNTTEKTMWKNELDEFVNAYQSYIQNIEHMHQQLNDLKAKNKKGKRKIKK